MLSFDELTDRRRSLQSFCLLHVPSLLKVQSGISFKLLPEDADLSDSEVRHITTTATCLSSLLDCPPQFQTAEFGRVGDLLPKFAKGALARPDSKWKSEGSAGVYCRCRALPMIIRASGVFDEKIEGHLRAILAQLKKNSGRFGVGEAGPGLPRNQWYPPNAFHSYWTLEILSLVEKKFRADYQRLSKASGLDLDRRRQGMLLWSRQQLGYQMGLHSAVPSSSVLDTDQLAWSLAIFLRFDQDLSVNLENRDFVKQALKCLFSTQTDGTWRHYKPLFHYKKAGNAYCYVFETFAVLLGCALMDGAKAEMIRELLKPYCKNLMDLWFYADSTKIPLYPDSKEIGWCSSHRTNVTSPESWATASVFQYAQALRRLIGIWCREQALASLNVPRGRRSPKEAADRISDRGKTWGPDKMPVSELLWTLFINPVKMHVCDDKLEPDSQPIAKDHARSAILFGPPGTSKTTLVRALADVVNWEYVEIHASHFVAEGLTQVQKTADRIFKQLSELDHGVVLFDEIDELVRERDIEKDAFGRFLTTSMLPKLALLWEARKIMYFVATNHINYFDSAIIRSRRFDALMLVSPPSFESKIHRLTGLLADHGLPGRNFQIREQQIQDQLVRMDMDLKAIRESETKAGTNDTEETRVARWREQELASERTLAKFALLRYDELAELARRLASILKGQSPIPEAISVETLQDALQQVADLEWRKNKSYVDYLRDTRSERRDYQMLNVWEVRTDLKSIPDVVEANNLKWLPKAVDSPRDIEISGFQLSPESQGRVEIRRSGAK